GGSLPGMTWHKIMAYAHQGIEIKPLAGLTPGQTPPRPATAAAESEPPREEAQRPAMLTKRGAEALVRLERLMANATRRLGVAGPDAGPTERRGAGLHQPDAARVQ